MHIQLQQVHNKIWRRISVLQPNSLRGMDGKMATNTISVSMRNWQMAIRLVTSVISLQPLKAMLMLRYWVIHHLELQRLSKIWTYWVCHILSTVSMTGTHISMLVGLLIMIRLFCHGKILLQPRTLKMVAVVTTKRLAAHQTAKFWKDSCPLVVLFRLTLDHKEVKSMVLTKD